MSPARLFVIGCVVLIPIQLIQGQPPDTQLVPAKDKATRVDSHGDPLPEGAIARLGTLRFRHDGAASALVYSPDGKILAGTCAGKVILWEAATGKKTHQLAIGSAGWLSRRALDFSPDGKVLAVAHGEPLGYPTDKFRNEISFWDVASGAYLRSIKSVRTALGSSLRFSPDGKTLALNTQSNELQLVEASSGEVLWKKGIPNSFAREFLFAPDGKTLALITGNPEDAQLWDAADGTLVRAFQHAKNNGIATITLAPDGKTLASATMDRLLLWDVARGKEKASLEAKIGWSIGLAFTPDGKTLVSGTYDTLVHAWDLDSKKLRHSLGRPLNSGGASLALSPDGKTAAMGTYYSQIHVWDLASGKELLADLPGHDSPIQSVAFSPDGRLLACGGDRRSVRIWDMKTLKPVRQIDSNAQIVSWSPDGKQLACVPFVASNFPSHSSSVPKADPVAVWDVATGKVLETLPGGGAGLLVWNAAGKVRAVPLAGGVLCPDGRTVIVFDIRIGGIRDRATFVRGIDLESGKESFSFRDDRVGGPICLSPDGTTLAAGAGFQGVRLWDLLLGKEIRALRLPLEHKAPARPVSVMAFSPDGRLVASSGGSPRHYSGDVADIPEIRVWDVSDGREVACFESDGGFVSSLAFSPDGKRLLSGMWNGTILVWDVAPWAGARKVAKDFHLTQVPRLWDSLASQDAPQAHDAYWALAGAPDEVVPLLKKYLLPEPKVAPEKIRQWITDLESDKFAVRDSATRQLRDLGPAAEGPLHQALAGKPPLETRKRLEALLQLTQPSPAAVLQSRRAVLVLERIGTKEAREVLQILAAGVASAPRTMEAQAALERLARRSRDLP